MLEILSERITITGYFTRNIRSTINDLDKLDFNYLYVVFEFQGGIGMFVVAVSLFSRQIRICQLYIHFILNRHTWTALGGATLKPYPHTIEMMILDY